MNTYERAIQVYQVLIAAAQNRQLLTYDIVGKHIGVPRQGLANQTIDYLLGNSARSLMPMGRHQASQLVVGYSRFTAEKG